MKLQVLMVALLWGASVGSVFAQSSPEGVIIAEGAAGGVFTVNANGEKVVFSQGNLQYRASTNTWRFATNQYDYVGEDNANISSTYTGWIDLFGWGTSGYNHGAVCYQPWSTSTTYSDYYAYGSDNNLYDQTGQADWGYNAISNGGNQPNLWRTLTDIEWGYIFNTRTTASGIRYAKANVNNVNGVILLPDDWSTSYYSLSNTNTYNASFSSNTITVSQWSALEQYGAVFLPAAGNRKGVTINNVGSYGNYWSACGGGGIATSSVFFLDSNLYTQTGYDRYYGQSVRLVRSVQGYSFGVNVTPSPAEGGLVTGGGSFQAGTERTLTATPSTGFAFANWTEDGTVVSTNASYTFAVTRERNLVANFCTPNASTHAINATPNPTTGGTVSGGGSYQEGVVCALTATASSGYVFFNWMENGSVVSTNATYSFTVSSDREVTANFVANGNITFSDASVKALCVAHWDTNGDGELSYVEAAAVTSLGSVFKNNTDIHSFNELRYFITLSSIGGQAFYGCTELTQVTIPEHVTSIGSKAFWNCPALQTVTFNALNCTNMQTSYNSNTYSVFSSDANGAASALTRVVIGSGVTRIPAYAFKGSVDIYQRLVIPASVKEIGNYAFHGCNSMVQMVIQGDGLQRIGEYAFYGCSALRTALNLPNSVSTVGQYAFYGCSLLPSLTIGEGVTSIGGYAFWNCPALATVHFNAANCTSMVTNSQYSVFNSGTSNGGATPIVTLTIGENVTGIPSYAFRNSSNATGNLLLPSGLTNIGQYSFYGCSGFTGNLAVPNAVTNLGQYAFWGCSGFNGTLTLPFNESFTTINQYAFYGCSGFTGTLAIPANVTSIASYAFRGCSGFTEPLVLHDAVTTVEQYAFHGCSNISALTIGESVTSIGGYAFWNCPAMATVHFNATNCTSMVTNSQYSVFNSGTSNGGATPIVTLTIGGNVTKIPDYAFRNSGNMVCDITIPNSVTSIGSYSFANCNGHTLLLGDAVTTIGTYAFSGCSGFTGDLAIPNSVTSLGQYAFRNCGGFNGSLVIGNGVQTISDYAFSGCSGFTGSLIVGRQVVSIGNYAFQNCSGFTTLISENPTPPTAVNNSFQSMNYGIPVHVPYGTVQNYQAAAGWNQFTNYREQCVFEQLYNDLWSDEMNWYAMELPGPDDVVCVNSDCHLDMDANVLHLYVLNLNDVFTIDSGTTLFTICGVGTLQPSQLVIADGGQLVNTISNTYGTVQKQVVGYGTGNAGWYTVATSVCGNMPIGGLVTGNYDLYAYDEPTAYWRNQKDVSNGIVQLNPVQGYLYANQTAKTLSMTGQFNASDAEISVPVTRRNGILPGFNLVGNPYTNNIGIGTVAVNGTPVATCYKAVGGSQLVAYTDADGDAIKPAEGFMVQVPTDGTLTFNAPARTEQGSYLCLTLSHDGQMDDRAYLCMNAGEGLDKAVMDGHPSLLYFVSGGQPMAVAPCRGQAYNLFLDAAESGTFSLESTLLGAECDYLHLMDRITGKDIDLKATPSYTFEAQSGDVPNRFILVLAEGAQPEAVTDINRTRSLIPILPLHGKSDDQPAYSQTNLPQITVLFSGWNWFSTYIEMDDPADLLLMLEESLGENGVQIKNADYYTAYEDEEWFGDLDDEGIFNEQMYKILVIDDCTVVLEGMTANPEEHAIDIEKGWNWIGFPVIEEMAIEDAFADFNAEEGDIIKNSEDYTQFEDGEWFGDLEEMVPGKGFMYFSNDNGIKTLLFSALQSVIMPSITTLQVSGITQTTATSGGNVTSDGGGTVTARGVCWSTNHNPTTSNSHIVNGTGTGSFTSSMTGLSLNTTYYVRAYATNSAGTAYGNEVGFTTLGGIPVVSTTTVSNITQTTAICSGHVTNAGSAAVTERGICWSTSHNPTVSGSHISNGTGTGAYTGSMTGLTPNTTYYVRAYAKNSQGTAYGSEVSFTTLQAAVPTVTTTQVTNVTQNMATGVGNVTANGGYSVTDRGVCWSTSHNPTISSNHVSGGSGSGSFNVNMTGLTPNTTYYARAYAKNSQGTAYGSEVSFTTLQNASVPTITTVQVTNITAYTASCGGNVTNNGGSAVTARGVCWSTSHYPTITCSHTSDGTGVGGFTSSMTNLMSNTTYYVRAYATNSDGTAYGSEVSFTTSAPQVPTGAINGLFSVNATQKVWFSQGNLQYNASTNTWKFAEHQYDYVGEYNANISSTYTGWIDLFGWGTSGYNHGAVCYQPWSTSSTYSDYCVYGNYTYNLYDQTGRADWGYNPISNGGNHANQWRTLTTDEWGYVFNTRTTISGIRYAKAKVNDVNGVILLPDDWNTSYYSLSSTNNADASFSSNTITASQWSTLEQHGAVFLPAAGERYGTTVSNVGSDGLYWSASQSNTGNPHILWFKGNHLYPQSDGGRQNGRSVRLIAPENLPTVTTIQITNIAQSTAAGGGNVTSDGGASVTERGICWSTSHNPTTSSSHTTDGSGTGSFTSSMTNLTPNITYYVRAYATNSAGTAYGNEVSFTTPPGGSGDNAPVGAINGMFSVSTTQQVWFSQGNLQYKASSNTWKFADHQYDCVGSDNSGISSTYSGWIDLFGWGTSGYNHGAVCYQPWSTSTTYSHYDAYGNSGYNLYNQTGQADWGYNPISNGGNQTNQWRTLTTDEWVYVFNTRTTASGIRYAKAQVNNVNGVILLPDDWNTSYFVLNETNNGDVSYYINTITASQWSTLEQHGAVFLPAAGYRRGSTVDVVGRYGFYWSASYSNSFYACSVYFNDSGLDPQDGSYQHYRHYGQSVRLVALETLPIVTTRAVSNIAQTTATGGGNVTTSTGGGTVTARGICWSTSHTPTTSGSHTIDGSDTGSFTSSMTNLTPNTTYYVRAYATNSAGTAYGNEVIFTTLGVPAVTTVQVTNITTTSAECSGNVSADGGATVTDSGICWSTDHTPTTSDSHASSGTGMGSYTCNMTDLTEGTTYYVRAYATNSVGTAYGSEVSFTTSTPPQAPTGAVNRLFSVSATQQVWFSQGNLQYKASSNTWKFADHQYDCVGSDNSGISSTYSGWIDLFGWGTSGYNHGAVCYQPWSTSTTYSDYYAYGNPGYNLYNQTGQADWGYNPISNGGNQTNQWRTLTTDEWVYVFNTRTTASGIRYAKAQVNNVNGVILLPDDWNTSYFALNETNNGDVSYYINTITASQWSTLEQHGAVFLPAAGYRDDYNGVIVSYVDSEGCYWSASYYNNYNNNAYHYYAYHMHFSNTGLNPQNGAYVARFWGQSVRLVAPENSPPTVTTNTISNIAQTIATGGGNVISAGGGIVTARGVCWSTSHNPTTNSSHTNDGSGIGSFTSSMTNLTPNTTYYVRAYATNSAGTAYGTEVSFTTSAPLQVPTGAINGLFSVNATQKVWFSQGNLQYNASTNTWKFAEHQYDYVGEYNANISSTYTGWIDLFGWGTSGYNHGAVCYQPWSTSSTYSDYCVYGNYTYNLYDQTGRADWGYNPISNGGNQANQWHTLTKDEWVYVFNTRTTSSGIRYAMAIVNNVNGVILLPDDWNTAYYSLSSTNDADASFSSNTISATQWSTLEQHGAVFLPAAGHRGGTTIYGVGGGGFYWSASYSGSNFACSVYFYDSYLGPLNYYFRNYGQSVRLVAPFEI